MGLPETENGRNKNEGPQHEVPIAKPFAEGRTDITFAEWDVCVALACALSGVGDVSERVTNVNGTVA